LNGFKAINDRYGHLEGNRVLRLFAQGLRESCREYDYVARMGGDEFVVCAPGLQPVDAPDTAARINEIARIAGLNVAESAVLSASVGFAFYKVDGTDAEQLLAEADRNMYGVKREHHQRRNLLNFPASSYAATIN
jgi:diguanylate cyclase (GGDEF)-like protein